MDFSKRLQESLLPLCPSRQASSSFTAYCMSVSVIFGTCLATGYVLSRLIAVLKTPLNLRQFSDVVVQPNVGTPRPFIKLEF